MINMNARNARFPEDCEDCDDGRCWRKALLVQQRSTYSRRSFVDRACRTIRIFLFITNLPGQLQMAHEGGERGKVVHNMMYGWTSRTIPLKA
jgi:hypothetical protein